MERVDLGKGWDSSNQISKVYPLEEVPRRQNSNASLVHMSPREHAKLHAWSQVSELLLTCREVLFPVLFACAFALLLVHMVIGDLKEQNFNFSSTSALTKNILISNLAGSLKESVQLKC